MKIWSKPIKTLLLRGEQGGAEVDKFDVWVVVVAAVVPETGGCCKFVKAEAEGGVDGADKACECNENAEELGRQFVTEELSLW